MLLNLTLTDDELEQVVGALFGSAMRLDLSARGRQAIHQGAAKRRHLARRLLDLRLAQASDCACIFSEDADLPLHSAHDTR